jgi:MmyB-like transcription regulator ligand binding domain
MDARNEIREFLTSRRAKLKATDVRFHISGVKHFHHDQVGDLELNYERLEVVFDTGLTIFTYTADPGTRSADALGLLGSLVATTEVARTPPAS